MYFQGWLIDFKGICYGQEIYKCYIIEEGQGQFSKKKLLLRKNERKKECLKTIKTQCGSGLEGNI